MQYRIWYSTEGFAEYIIANTTLSTKNCVLKKMYESDASRADFHTMPDHIKQILYLDAPDIIVELDTEPIFSIELSKEAGTGHNVFQRFARLAASVENNVPSFYIYPEGKLINRKVGGWGWDTLNPLIFYVLDKVMNIYNIPSLFYYFPSDYRGFVNNPGSAPHKRSQGLQHEKSARFSECPLRTDGEMQHMFSAMNEIIRLNERYGVIEGRDKMLGNRIIQTRRDFMNTEYHTKGGGLVHSPLTATEIVDTEFLLNSLSKYEGAKYSIGELLKSRPETILYKANAAFRGDPYPGCLAAIDYAICREGKTFEERRHNLVMVWGDYVLNMDERKIEFNPSKSSINDFVNEVQGSEAKNLLTKDYNELRNDQIPRYYMQVRYGSMFSKVKHIRVYSYFADAILFADGALWRDA